MAEVIYTVKVWADPVAGQGYIDWLTGGHVAAVAANPGVKWARLTRLEETSPDGWTGFMAVYAFESREALSAYQASDLFKSFTPVYEKYNGLFRVERALGEVIESHDT